MKSPTSPWSPAGLLAPVLLAAAVSSSCTRVEPDAAPPDGDGSPVSSKLDREADAAPALPADPAGPPPVSHLEGEGATADPHAVLEADDPVFDWGTAYQGQKFAHTFRLTCRGTVPLTIREVKTTCGCAVPDESIRNRTLAPGETLAVTIEVDTTKFTGYTRKDAEVVCDQDVAGDIKLWLQGDVRQLLRRDPDELTLEVVRDASMLQNAELRVRLVSNVDSPVTVRSITADKGMVTTEIEETEEGKVFELLLRPQVDLSDKVVLHAESLTAKVEVGGDPVEIAIPVRIKIGERIQVLPARSVAFSRDATRTLADADAPLPRQTLEIRSLGGPEHRFAIQSVEVVEKRVKAWLETVEAGRHYRLTVELLRPEKVEKLIKDAVYVDTDDPEVGRIKIPCTAIF